MILPGELINYLHHDLNNETKEIHIPKIKKIESNFFKNGSYVLKFGCIIATKY